MTTNKFTFVTDTKESVKERKKALRAYMKTRRGDNENRDIKEYALIENMLAFIGKILKREGAGTPLRVFCYLSYSSEAPTDRLIERLLELGIFVYCPRLENGEMQAVALGEDMSLSSLGIREPVGEPYLGELDLAITPMLAVDGKGNRLGYGGGCYDRFFKAHKEIRRVAYGYDFQVLKCVPTEAWDEPMQAIVTEKRIITI